MSSNVHALFAVNTLAPDNASIAKNLRQVAEAIESGSVYGTVGNVVCLIETDDGTSIERVVIGRPIDNARVVGLLTIATHHAAGWGLK